MRSMGEQLESPPSFEFFGREIQVRVLRGDMYINGDPVACILDLGDGTLTISDSTGYLNVALRVAELVVMAVKARKE